MESILFWDPTLLKVPEGTSIDLYLRPCLSEGYYASSEVHIGFQPLELKTIWGLNIWGLCCCLLWLAVGLERFLDWKLKSFIGFIQ